MNQLVAVDYPGSDADLSFTYDAAGQRTQLGDHNGATTWEYDSLGRTTSITDPFGQAVTYTYDASGNRTSLTYPDGKTVAYGYDAGDRLTSVTDWQSLITEYSYTSANELSSVALPNGVTTTYIYDAASQLKSITDATSETELASYQYTYDNAGNRTQVVESIKTGQESIPTVSVTVKDTQGAVQAGLQVYAFNGTTFTGFSAITDENGTAKFILPEGSYRFRADKNGLEYYSAAENHCTVLGCTSAEITVPVFTDVTVTVVDSAAVAQAALPVYVYTDTTYTGFTDITDEEGKVVLTLPEGSYRFRTDKNNEQFFSSTSNDCTTPACTTGSIVVPQFSSVTVTVVNSAGVAQADLPVYAYTGTTYSGYNAITDANGQAVLLMHEGSYRFRTDVNNLQYFSSSSDDCVVMGCASAAITVPIFGQVTVSVLDSGGTPQSGLPVYAFDGSTYKGFFGTTGADGTVTLTLPEGDFRFRTDLNGGQFFSAAANDCSVPACTSSGITVPRFDSVTVLLTDNNGLPLSGLPVYAFNGSTYSGYNSSTDENGEAVLLLREGDYRFRTDYNGTQYFSASANHCTVLGCTSAQITVTVVTATLTPTLTSTAVWTDTPTPTETPTLTPEVTETPTVPASETPTETPTLPASETPTETATETPTEVTGLIGAGGPILAKQGWPSGLHEDTTTVTVSVVDTTGAVMAGLTVYVFSGTTYKSKSGVTDSNGQVVFSLAAGSYRFRADTNNHQYYSGASDTCTTPECAADTVTVPVFGTVSVSVLDSTGAAQPGLSVYAYNGTTYAGYSAVSGSDGIAIFTLPEGSYRFRADTHGLQYFSASANHCSVPTCTSAGVTVPVFGNVTIKVTSTAGIAQAGLPVYAFNGNTYTGFHGTTDAGGLVTLTLPEGNYRFRTDLNGAQYFSGTENHCAVSGCGAVSITTPVYGTVTVTVSDSASTPLAGLPVYAFNGTTYTGKSGTSDANGQVTFNLPEGNYRYRSDLNGIQYFSAAENHCAVPACSSAGITAAVFGDVTVTVLDSDGTAQAGLPVYVFSGSAYRNYTAVTDAAGQVTFSLPEGSYRFRTELHGAQYFSSETDDCAVTACTSASVTVPVYGEVTVTAQSSAGKGQAGLSVYAFDGSTYTGISGVTGEDGQAALWLPEGSYRFRADQFELQFFSDSENHCSVPECTMAVVSTLGMQEDAIEQTITYSYDDLNRLTRASYDDGSYYEYTYDAAGNRLTETTGEGSTSYSYDAANRLTAVNDQAYAWDNNGNLLSDGTKTYSYDAANHLTGVSSSGYTYQYIYNGLGDRVQSVLDGVAVTYVLDLNSGLTQVLADGSNTYLYGLSRIAQVNSDTRGYFLGDGLGSVRQVVDPEAAILLMQSYDPFGETTTSIGDYDTDYGYTGEQIDVSGLIYLRARYYDPGTGRFLTRDPFAGYMVYPTSQNGYSYVYNNPLLYTDPSGRVIPLLVIAGVGFAVGALINVYVQTDGFKNFCDYDILETLAWGVGGAVLATSAALLAVEGLSVIGLGLQGGALALDTIGISSLLGVSTVSVWTAGTATVTASSLLAAWLLTDTTSVWNLNPLERGVKIEQKIGRSPELSRNYPTIDRWNNGKATSIKSIDLSAQSYQNTTYLEWKVKSYVKQLAGFQGATWGDFSIAKEAITSRELILAIPPNATASQMETLLRVQDWANTLKVTVEFVVIP